MGSKNDFESTSRHFRWETPASDLDAESKLQRELGLPLIVARLLVVRGYSDPAEAHKFLNPQLDHFHDPALLPDYESAKNEILGAKERKEKIFIHGDYDVDGVTSAALLYRFLSRLECDVEVHVPHRMKEGYGIHLDAVKRAQDCDTKLFLTCDCGVGAHEQVEAAREAGMRVVVTDHHQVPEVLPNAHAVVNPHRTDFEYPFESLSGVGVVFKLCAGLSRELGHSVENYYRAYLDLTVLGTIADVMPLVDENRIIASYGLPLLGSTKKPGLQALMRVSEMNPVLRPVTSFDVGFRLGPRLNAAGRLDDAAHSLRLLLTQDQAEADRIAQMLDQFNSARRLEQTRIFDEASAMVRLEASMGRRVLVAAGEGWHAGVVGIVASKLVDTYYRPSFVISLDGEVGRGSARSVEGFDLGAAIRACRSLLEGGGGHAQAAGISLRIELLDRFKEAIEDYAIEHLRDEDLTPTLFVDAEVAGADCSLEALESLQAMEPFGEHNPEPFFVAQNVTVVEIMPTSKPEHCRATLRTADGQTFASIGFGIGQAMEQLIPGDRINAFFMPTIDDFRGNRKVKWQLKDFEVVGS